MKRKYERVYQFKIGLKGIKPLIWRRIQVQETYSFWDLHVAIQDAIGWLDYHLHRFEMVDPSAGVKNELGIPDGEPGLGDETLPGWEQKIAEYFSMGNKHADYIYDFGDNWIHRIELEKILPRDEDVKYPVCIAGKRACPPEDCGGPFEYDALLKTIKDPQNKEHKKMLEWVGGEFDPEHFDVKEISFDDPDKRWKIAFEGGPSAQ